MVDPKVWQQVPHQQILETESLSDVGESSNGDGNTEIGEENQILVLVLVEWAGGDEVIDTATDSVLLSNTFTFKLTFVIVVSSNVGQDVHGPSNQLLSNKPSQTSDWGLLGELM